MLSTIFYIIGLVVCIAVALIILLAIIFCTVFGAMCIAMIAKK